MKLIETKFGQFIDEIEINGEMHSAFANGDYFIYVNKAGEVAHKEYAPGAESGFKEISKVF